MVIKVEEMIIDKHPLKLSNMHFIWVYLRLHTPTKLFSSMESHSHLPKVKCREELVCSYNIQCDLQLGALTQVGMVKMPVNLRSSHFVLNLWFAFLNFRKVAEIQVHLGPVNASFGKLSILLDLSPHNILECIPSKSVPHFPLMKYNLFNIFFINIIRFEVIYSMTFIHNLVWKNSIETLSSTSKG